MNEKKVCPVDKVLDLLATGDMTDAVKLKGWLELFGYVYARVKEQADDPRENLEKLTNAELIQRVEGLLKELREAA